MFKNSLSQRLVRAQEEYLQQKDILDRKDDLLTEKQDELNALMSKLSKCEQVQREHEEEEVKRGSYLYL